MVKRKPYKGRKFRTPLVYLPIDANIGLTTLTSGSVKSGAMHTNFDEDFFVLSAKLEWTYADGTSGEVPIHVGLAHGDYSDAEIEEHLEVELLGPGTKIEQERQRRLVRRVGHFNDPASVFQTMHHGLPVSTPCKFVVQNGKAMKLWGHNKSGADLTGAARIQVDGYLIGRWIL